MTYLSNTNRCPMVGGSPGSRESPEEAGNVTRVARRRVVYEVKPDRSVVIVWVVGKRADNEVYAIARSRLAAYADPARRAILQAILDAAGG